VYNALNVPKATQKAITVNLYLATVPVICFSILVSVFLKLGCEHASSLL